MHKKTVVHTQEIQVPAIFSEINPDHMLLDILYSLSSEFDYSYRLYQTHGTIWAYYPHSCFMCDSLFDEYGILMAAVSRKFPVFLYGNSENMETAELTSIYFENQSRIIFTQKNISGRDFEELSDLCVKVEVPDQEMQKELFRILSNIDFRHDFLAVKRTLYTKSFYSDYEQAVSDTYYQFIPMSEDADFSMFFCSLTIEQQKKLWLLLLQDEVSAVEFEYVLEALENHLLPSLFSWEFSLRLALDETGIQVHYNDMGFHISRKDGSRIIYDYETGTAAQKLFLKILFPVVPRRN